ncbi:phosphatidylglycerophosphatase A [Oikeobacillus pervagus]|uniref:Phosphatidylglycerophosphatase A n=1 Tax=Oikeobacillus pervagus TaxID=1325931 RepID=A0AAJ1SZC1_9BACI|nr:phosphatidylglycerophosphatase A [Oikeobacillus pervagus]MDQ0215633.1 phosphatidylglycerophosphatase A [Oikeobacillus pervagus]
MKRRVHSEEVTKAAIQKLKDRGVTILDIAEIVFELQSPYSQNLTLDECVDSVENVLLKREIQHAILVGVELDTLAEQGKLSEPLQSIVETDESLFGIDETIALGASLGYGSIAVTNYGHLDSEKIGIIKNLDTKMGEKVHTFLDDLIGAIAASAASRLAHRIRDYEDELTTAFFKENEKMIK